MGASGMTDGLLTVSARDHGTGRAQTVVVTPNSGLSEAEIASLLQESIEMGARLEDVAGIIHAHPTLGEAVRSRRWSSSETPQVMVRVWRS